MILFQCDECGQIVGEAEALGPGVIFQTDNRGYTQGKPFEWKVPDNVSPDLTLIIQLTAVENQEQFCYACMWRALKELIKERAPADLFNLEYGWVVGQDSAAIVEVPNEPEDADRGTTAANLMLPEMHAEGHLPETGTSTDPEEPGSEGS